MSAQEELWWDRVQKRSHLMSVPPGPDVPPHFEEHDRSPDQCLHCGQWDESPHFRWCPLSEPAA